MILFLHSVDDLNNFFVQSAIDINTADVTRNTNGFNDSDFHWNYITPLMIHNVFRKNRSNARQLA